jgi:hypothetical protein
MNYKTLLGAINILPPTGSYDGSGIIQQTPISPVEETPSESTPSDKEVIVSPTGGEDYSKYNAATGEQAIDKEESSFNPTLILGVLAVAYFLFIKKKK